jgi:SAM-dependent methyltransferase
MRARLDRLGAPLLRCARGELPANVALAHLLMEARDAAEVQLAICDVIRDLRQQRSGEGLDRLLHVQDLWNETPGAFAAVNGAARTVEHGHDGAAQTAAHWAYAFDRAAGTSSAAGVALYSLGRNDLLQAATDEIVGCMRLWKLLALEHVALDLGCGNGRVTRALAGDVHRVIAIDVSPAMLSAARFRCADLRNALFARTSGHDLAAFPDASFDLVYAVDSFPYLVMSGLAERHVGEAARVLRRGGHLLILNYSYRNDPDADRADVAEMSREAGLTVRRNGTRDFRLWDGLSFLSQKAT